MEDLILVEFISSRNEDYRQNTEEYQEEKEHKGCWEERYQQSAVILWGYKLITEVFLCGWLEPRNKQADWKNTRGRALELGKGNMQNKNDMFLIESD